jgi:NifU-like protein involved in Fe-S cluster formation
MLTAERIELLKRIDYSAKAIDILERDLNIGEISAPDIRISDESSCGDLLILDLSIGNDVISDAKYRYIGCIGMQLAASALTQLVKGTSLAQAARITEDSVVQYLEKVPEQKVECIEFAVKILKKALAKYQAKAGEVLQT